MRILKVLLIAILFNACTQSKEQSHINNDTLLTAKRDSIIQSKKDSIFKVQQRTLFLKDSLKTVDSLKNIKQEKAIKQKKASEMLQIEIPEFTSYYDSYRYNTLDKNLPKKSNGDAYYINKGETYVYGKFEMKNGGFCFYESINGDPEFCETIIISEQDEETGARIFTSENYEVMLQYAGMNSMYKLNVQLSYNFDRKYQLYSDFIIFGINPKY